MDAPIDRPRIVVGRAVDADIRLSAATLSRSHLEILSGDTATTCRRLSENNKVVLNGTPIETARLYDGDVLRIGPYTLCFQSPRPCDQRPGTADDDAGTVLEAPREDDDSADHQAGNPPPPPPPAPAPAPAPAPHPAPPASPATAEAPPRLVGGPLTAPHPLDQPRVVIGRHTSADIRVDSRYVSRQHLELTMRDGLWLVRNISTSDAAATVNDVPIPPDGVRLWADDRIALDTVTFRFLSARASDQRDADEEATELRPTPPAPESPPNDDDIPTILGAAPPTGDAPAALGGTEDASGRLLVQAPGQPERVHALGTAGIDIGRGSGADIRVEDTKVSRQQARVEATATGTHFRCYPSANPMSVNDQPATHGQLFDGDVLRVGSTSITFVSTRPADRRPPPHDAPIAASAAPLSTPPAHPPPRRPRSAAGPVGLLFVLLLGAGGYLGYSQVWVPFAISQDLNRIDFMIAEGRTDAAAAALPALLARPLDVAAQDRARSLMVQVATAQIDAYRDEGKLTAAKAAAHDFLAQYGAWTAAAPVWDRLDAVQFALARRMEEEGRGRDAMRLYLGVRPQAALYGEAQEAASDIWHAFQSEQMRDIDDDAQGAAAAVTALLRQAEVAFADKRFTTPASDSAYAYYTAVLDADPGNTLALAGIQDIKDHYRLTGDRLFDDGAYSKAISYYQRYLMIEPGSADMQARLAQARTLAARDQAPPATGGGPAAKASASSGSGGGANASAAAPGDSTEAASQDRVRRLLEDADVDADLVMDYLFSADPEAAPGDTPW